MRKNKGFSLVELIIVIAIMAILVGVMAPQLIKYIEKANVASDKQIADTVHKKGAILKVIIETCSLEEDEKTALCRIVTDAGADFIKTSTGFGTAGATVEDVALMNANTGAKVKVKAAGGIRSEEAAREMIKAGASRIGASRL